MVYITTLFASVLALVYIQISLRVHKLQKLHQVSKESVDADAMQSAIRAHGYFVEYVPLSLVLMTLLEINDAPSLLVSAMGACLLVGVGLHVKGMRDAQHGMSNRVAGTKWLFLSLALLALSNILWMGYLLVQSMRFAASVFVH
jgi:uncharacterized membrane protein YecN with MAPEG domain